VTPALLEGKTVMMIHGHWHGGWCFAKVERLLAQRGIATIAPDLPGHGMSSASGVPPCDLHQAAASVRALLDDHSAPVILVGHSAGGAVITEAAANHPAVVHLVYLCGFMLDVGESLGSLLAEVSDGVPRLAPGAGIEVRKDGTTYLLPDVARDAFYADCTPADASWAIRQLSDESAASARQTPHAVAWHGIPSTYVIAGADHAVPPVLQRRLASRASATVEWPTGHSPFLSRPELVADLLADLAAEQSMTGVPRVEQSG
jgi:pimeloyl-ACP methyl ester carboxylesterase